jgi:hypothetical protein
MFEMQDENKRTTDKKNGNDRSKIEWRGDDIIWLRSAPFGCRNSIMNEDRSVALVSLMPDYLECRIVGFFLLLKFFFISIFLASERFIFACVKTSDLIEMPNMIANYARCSREIKSGIVMVRAAFKKKNTLFTANWTEI